MPIRTKIARDKDAPDLSLTGRLHDVDDFRVLLEAIITDIEATPLEHRTDEENGLMMFILSLLPIFPSIRFIEKR